MANIIKTLKAGNLMGAGTTVYAVPAGKSALVKSIRLVNGLTTGATTALNLYVKPSGAGTARRIHDRNFTIATKGSLVIDDVVTLGQGDELQIELAGGSQDLFYMFNGIERE